MDKMEKTLEPFSGTLTLTGESQVQAKPDVVRISLGVLTTAKTSQEAVGQNAQQMTQVISRIKGLCVPDADIQTTDLNISPIIDAAEHSPTRGQIVGYKVEDTLKIQASVDKAGAVFDAAVAAGANQAGSLTFGLRDPSPYQQQALEAAIRAAQSSAERIAYLLGVGLRSPRVADVSYGGSPMVLRGSLIEKLSSTPMEAGSMTLSATVNMTYGYSAGDIPHYQNPAAPVVAHPGELFMIALTANHTTPYRWQLLTQLASAPVTHLGTSYVIDPSPPGQPPLLGRGGQELWLFKAACPGRITLRFEQSRLGSTTPSEPAAQTEFSVLVERG